MTRAILRVLVTAMVAGGLAVGCSSHGTAIGPHGPDAQAPGSDGPAGGGGAAGSGSDAAAAGSGGGGGVTASGGVTAATASTETGGATGSGGSMRAGGATSSGGVTNSGGATSSGGSSASGGSGGKGGAGGSGGATSTGSPDASADKPPATWGTPCSSQDDCVFSTGMYLMCRAPGESIGCGACRLYDRRGLCRRWRFHIRHHDLRPRAQVGLLLLRSDVLRSRLQDQCPLWPGTGMQPEPWLPEHLCGR
jgi:hypothetical protein